MWVVGLCAVGRLFGAAATTCRGRAGIAAQPEAALIATLFPFPGATAPCGRFKGYWQKPVSPLMRAIFEVVAQRYRLLPCSPPIFIITPVSGLISPLRVSR
ncbi:hypothetical protein YSKK_21140 [Halopseudomonas aestusnigri]|nr:hypothetical protein YSKK_21140 [Halopseudomonas aestusnigri]